LEAAEEVSMAWAQEFLYIYIYIQRERERERERVEDDFIAMPHDHCFAPRCKKASCR